MSELIDRLRYRAAARDDDLATDAAARIEQLEAALRDIAAGAEANLPPYIPIPITRFQEIGRRPHRTTGSGADERCRELGRCDIPAGTNTEGQASRPVKQDVRHHAVRLQEGVN